MLSACGFQRFQRCLTLALRLLRHLTLAPRLLLRSPKLLQRFGRLRIRLLQRLPRLLQLSRVLPLVHIDAVLEPGFLHQRLRFLLPQLSLEVGSLALELLVVRVAVGRYFLARRLQLSCRRFCVSQGLLTRSICRLLALGQPFGSLLRTLLHRRPLRFRLCELPLNPPALIPDLVQFLQGAITLSGGLLDLLISQKEHLFGLDEVLPRLLVVGS